MNNLSITIGQYVPGNSWVYKLDPRFKIMATIILMIALFLIPNIMYMLIALGLMILVVLLGRLPITKIIKGLKPILMLSLFSFCLQVFYTQEGSLLYTFNLEISILHIVLSVLIIMFYLFTNRFTSFKITYLLLCLIGIFSLFCFVNFSFGVITNLSFGLYDLGLLNGSFFILRIILVIMLSTILTLTTSSNDINTALDSLLRPFKFFLPVGEISTMIALSLRFIPTLLMETNKIMNAQASRGVDFNEGNLIQKVKQIVTLLIPMFVVSFKRADDLANAMEARGYVIGEERSSYNVLKYKAIDFIGYLFVFVFLGLCITLKVIA